MEINEVTTQVPKKPSKWRTSKKNHSWLSKRQAKRVAYPRRIFRIRKKHGRQVKV